MMRALIIDDELHNRELLHTLLQKYCPNVTVIGDAEDADHAFELINKQRPELIFLDIRMPGKTGFDLLRMFDEITFEVIFVSGFDEYALPAFEFNALGYILKPIDYTHLTAAVNRVEKKIQTARSDADIIHFIKSLDEKEDLINRLSVHHCDKVIFLNITEITAIEAKTDYCRIELIDKSHYCSSKDLKLFENMLEVTGYFIRINKSVIVNVNHVKSYSKGELCIIELKSGTTYEVSRRKKTEIISCLKAKSK